MSVAAAVTKIAAAADRETANVHTPKTASGLKTRKGVVSATASDLAAHIGVARLMTGNLKKNLCLRRR